MKQQILYQQSVFDRQFNLMYMPTYSFDAESEDINEGSFWNKKSKISSSKKVRHPKNIMIHDIPKDMDFWYFQDNELEEDEYLRAFMFEQYFDVANRSMQLTGYGSFTVVNNFDLNDRTVQNRLLVETYQEDKAIKRIWLGDKWGIDKVPLIEIGKDTQWHYDVYNRMIRIFNLRDHNLDIQILDF